MKLKKILLASAIVASLAGIMATSSFAEDTFNAVWNPETNSVDITGCKAPAEGGRKTVLVVNTKDGTDGTILDTISETDIMQIDEQGTAYTSVYVGPDKLTEVKYYEIRIGGDGTLQRMAFLVPKKSTNPYENSTRLIGDPSGDNKINNTDVTYVINHVVSISELTGESLQAADVNADNKVNNTDATFLINNVVGIDTTTIDGKKTVGDRTEYVPETK